MTPQDLAAHLDLIWKCWNLDWTDEEVPRGVSPTLVDKIWTSPAVQHSTHWY